MTVTMTTRAVVEMAAALAKLGNGIDPEKPAAFDATLLAADALTATAPIVARRDRALPMLQAQHGFGSLKEGDAIPPEYRAAVEELGAVEVEIDLPRAFTRVELRAVLKPGGLTAAEVAKLGPMLESRAESASK